mmetsp:Transcript_78697/g.131959  ORF Transcript_78697/g.131959 Transcript_78697/m.131959 type:complete len:84 (-) Transcript_78697:1082-1333(-)
MTWTTAQASCAHIYKYISNPISSQIFVVVLQHQVKAAKAQGRLQQVDDACSADKSAGDLNPQLVGFQLEWWVVVLLLVIVPPV